MDKENMKDSKGRPKKSPPPKGIMLTAWGETKSSGAWMKDKRKHPDIGFCTFAARVRRGMSVEDALTKPLFRRAVTKETKNRRKEKRLVLENKRNKQFAFAAMIRKLYNEGEHIDDLEAFFQLKRPKLQSIVHCRTWYNPSVDPCPIPNNYQRYKRRLPPNDVTKHPISGWYYDNKYGIRWDNGYYWAYDYSMGCKSCGKHTSAVEAAKVINEIYVANKRTPPYKIE